MADATFVQLTGLWGAVGRDVAVFCVGLDCGDYTVDSAGTVTVPFGSDVDGLFTIARVQAVHAEGIDWGALAVDMDIYTSGAIHTYTVPCVVGFAYTSRGKVARPVTADEIKSPHGAGFGKTRRVHQFGVLVDSSIGVSYGTDFDNLYAASYADAAGVLLDHATMFSGIHWDTLEDDYSTDGAICWEISRPYPTVVMTVTGFMETAER